MIKELEQLKARLKGELLTDEVSKILYSTDASAYREKPLAVFVPESDCVSDLRLLLDFCKRHNTFIIPRAAGTSLAGQVVGSGIVVDVSRNLKQIIEINEQERWVKVQPGVVLEELNRALLPHNLFFAPETSTANRCCIGGMVGNNSCGLHSLVYGSVREHLLEARVMLADGEETVLKKYSESEFVQKAKSPTLEGKIYNYILETYAKNEKNQALIAQTFPDKEVKRRNNGYALDAVCEENAPNLAKLFCGSEGTLGFATEFKLNLLPLPPKEKAVLCVHFDRLEDAFYGNLTALEHSPVAVELMDSNIIEAARRNLAQKENTFFIKGEPKAVLIVEFLSHEIKDLEARIERCIADFQSKGTAYAFSSVYGEEVSKVWNLRKAGLGLLSNVPGSAKPVSVVEDTAVNVKKLPQYLAEFQQILEEFGLKNCVYHAHIATGELHLRPIIDLKTEDGVRIFKQISHRIAILVKKYGGSLSGEHGDGRLRGEYIPIMYSPEVYELMVSMKKVWDSCDVFNRYKIVNTPPMDKNLRYEGANQKISIKTYYSFEREIGYLSAAEQCNGAADCRKSAIIGGLMCPTFKVSGKECETPRARANILREIISFSDPKTDPFSDPKIKEILDDCLMCKACKRECPSNVDITKLKSEALQHYYDAKGYPISVILMNYLPRLQAVAAFFSPKLYNFLVSNAVTGGFIRHIMGFSPQRQLPKIGKLDIKSLFSEQETANFDTKVEAFEPKKSEFFGSNTPHFESKSLHLVKNSLQSVKKSSISESKMPQNNGTIYLYIDEFSRFQDANVAKIAVKLFTSLGYKVKKAPITESGRIAISKGMLKRAKHLAEKNVAKLRGVLSESAPIVGIEPSATLSFRDEYPELLCENLGDLRQKIFLFDEFIAREIAEKRITKEQFTAASAHILLHGHCQQKALIGTKSMEIMLSLPENYTVNVVPSGCCGMAGSYGYEKKHYEMSHAIADSVLIPAIKAASEDTVICAPGTSCREQIRHFARREALHPLEILYQALKTKQI